MPRSLILLLALATLSAGSQAYATDAAGQATSSNDSQAQSQPAPIVHAYADQNGAADSNPQATRTMPARKITSSQPIPGVILRVDANTAVETVSADAKGTELRITHGVADVSVHHPGKDTRILVDLPGGQTNLLKDGIYTFNADTNTVRTLKGEADAFPGSAVEGIKLKEDHQITFTSAANGNRPAEVSGNELMADYLPSDRDTAGRGDGYRAGYGPYGDGFYGYGYPSAYGYGYPYGYYGYPYGYGLGLGFGYFGGFGGGFRGGFHGGYHGGFHGRR